MKKSTLKKLCFSLHSQRYDSSSFFLLFFLTLNFILPINTQLNAEEINHDSKIEVLEGRYQSIDNTSQLKVAYTACSQRPIVLDLSSYCLESYPVQQFASLKFKEQDLTGSHLCDRFIKENISIELENQDICDQPVHLKFKGQAVGGKFFTLIVK